LTPCSVSDECASNPRTQASLLACARRRLHSSQLADDAASGCAAAPMSAISRRTDATDTSS
jgi:hypothetical protein